MLRSKGMYTAVGALTCAMGIGFFMQSSDTAERHYGDGTAAIPAEDLPVLQSAAVQNAVLDVQDATLTSAEFETALAVPDVPEAEAEMAVVAEPQPTDTAPVTPSDSGDMKTAAVSDDITAPVDSAQTEPAPICQVIANARPVAAAMVELSMQACFPNERVTVHHNGMIFTQTTKADGSLSLTVPALTKEAVFILAFPNGEGGVAQATVEELDDFDRVVLQWKGNTTGFQVHAREFGANYGGDGHIWAEAPGDIAAAVTGGGGFLTRLGDTDAAEPLLAEVYSFPKVTSGRSGSVALSVEAEVTGSNCGNEIEAQSLEVQPDGQIKTQNLTLAVPECDAMGTFLVLNNLLQDLKLAGS